MAAYDIGAAVDAREIPSSNDQTQTPARVLPVLDYRTADSPGEPDRRLLGTGASIWAVVMLFGNIIALPAHDEYTHNLRRQDESAWSQNELQRRGCERDRRAGIASAPPPPLPRLHAPYHWIDLPLAALLLASAVLGLGVGRLAHHALKRSGRFDQWARRFLPFMFVLPSLVLLIGLLGYGIEAWRLFTLPVFGCGWIAVGTLLLAAWVRRERQASEADGPRSGTFPTFARRA